MGERKVAAPVSVVLASGDRLTIDISKDRTRKPHAVMTGAACCIYDGVIEVPILKEKLSISATCGPSR